MGPNIKFIPYHASIGIRHVNKFPLCPIEFDELEDCAQIPEDHRAHCDQRQSPIWIR